MRTFQWMNESKMTEENGLITIHAPAETDYFNYGLELDADGMPDESAINAPVYYTEVTGDFVLRVKVSLPFEADYDACALLVMKDDRYWGKLCFEKTDFDTRAVVSVVTNVRSDDANGCNVDSDAVWLQIARDGHYFAFHYSLDGEKYDMVRLFWLETDQPLKVGLLAQSPIGKGGPRYFENLTIENKTVEDLRQGK